MKIAGIYLATGSSSRMGSNKLALAVGTKRLGSLAVQTALQSTLDHIYIITKETDEATWLSVEVKSHARCTIIPCSTAHKGQSESLRCGIQQAQKDEMDAVIVILADQPFITSKMIDEMIICREKNPTCKFVATAYNQTITPPVLFPSSMYTELLKLSGDKGAKEILHGDFLVKGKLLPCTDKRLVFDGDTQQDYQTLQSMKKRNDK